MNDDMVKLARAWDENAPPTPPFYATGGLIFAMADRIEELEAKLAGAVEFTKGVIRHAGNSGDDYLAEQARTILEELKG